MLIASRSGTISAAKLIAETNQAWILEVEKREVRISKSDPRQRAFVHMDEALEWAGAEPELVEHFKQQGNNAGGVRASDFPQA